MTAPPRNQADEMMIEMERDQEEELAANGFRLPLPLSEDQLELMREHRARRAREDRQRDERATDH